jgi:pyruvate kinase
MSSKPSATKRTKIVCTLGPATDDEPILDGIIRAGMDVARLNLSHGVLEDHNKRLRMVRAIAGKVGRHVAVMIDTRGPDIRIGELETPTVELTTGQTFILASKPMKGNSQRVSVTYPGLPALLKAGDRVYLHDGLIELKVIDSNPDETKCEVVSGGILMPRKGVYVPGKSIPLPVLTPADICDLTALIGEGIDYISASFIKTPDDYQTIKSELNNPDVPVIAKLETAEGVANLDDIVGTFDGVMVARGDLGIEIPPENVPGVQKRIIRIAREFHKPVITATEMLESMVENPRPTRAEIGDVANAVLDGTSAVMLSEETAVGKFPVEAVKIMSRVCIQAERDLPFAPASERTDKLSRSLRGGIAHAAYFLARDIDAVAIICVTDSGGTARHFSRLQPSQPVLACAPNERVARRLALYWGIVPIVVDPKRSIEELLDAAISAGKQSGLFAKGDRIVFTGNTSGSGGETNMLVSVMVD